MYSGFASKNSLASACVLNSNGSSLALNKNSPKDGASCLFCKPSIISPEVGFNALSILVKIPGFSTWLPSWYPGLKKTYV